MTTEELRLPKTALLLLYCYCICYPESTVSYVLVYEGVGAMLEAEDMFMDY